jgi:hypothetical protein
MPKIDPEFSMLVDRFIGALAANCPVYERDRVYDPVVFGNGYVTLDAGWFRVRLVRDRGLFAAEFSSCKAPDEWWDLELIVAASKESAGPYDAWEKYPDTHHAQIWVDHILKHHDQIGNLLNPATYAVSKERLELLGEVRSHARFGC